MKPSGISIPILKLRYPRIRDIKWLVPGAIQCFIFCYYRANILTAQSKEEVEKYKDES